MEPVSEEQIIAKVKSAVLNDLKESVTPAYTEKDKGDDFEKYVVDRFKKPHFTIIEWRSDKYSNGQYAESNKNPDLEIEFNSRYMKSRFAVECKWRAELNGNVLCWAKDYQVKNYRNFQNRHQMTVFVIIGLGGTPKMPDSVYIIPLDDINSHNIPEYQLRKYYRHRTGDFFLEIHENGFSRLT